MKPLIEVKNLTIEFFLKNGNLKACDNITFTIYKNEVVGIIGESGSGKSTLASGILNLVQAPGKITSGEVYYYDDTDTKINLLDLSVNEFNEYRWKEIATVFQAAQNALNPVLKVKEHFIETVLAHDSNAKEEEIIKKAEEVLKHVRLDVSVLEYYPHQLSGGMKQRVLIALSLILEPKVILLDEPTTALDVITQWYILDILQDIHKRLGVTLIFLTHDISVISGVIDRIAVMYAGELVEYGEVDDVFEEPSHPYTKGLLNAIPTLSDDVTKRKAIPGNPPNLTQDFRECKFSPRCSVFLEGKCDADREKTKQMYFVNKTKCTRCYTFIENLENEEKEELEDEFIKGR
ncbi:MAG: ABC transporter ATP-binding protein [Clostridium sp.]|uniref:ABC transporter ATP-binding protein n=1 Tax=Clostridium sp. TaxID=1506 RepID=UPI001EB22B79|nr:ABC transporter ATP-binding protein [Clostridium sp.]MBS5884581.1 ABC transporter ATP-binding protein [Clostridium sp.]MDU7148985.1 ABC transporter ATP-binding protein [Clostridium sp.]MDU7242421.1 ABC transporter ATP-binding protein [Clostridium sp.]